MSRVFNKTSLKILIVIVLLGAIAFTAYVIWLTPETRQQRYSRMSLSEEKCYGSFDIDHIETLPNRWDCPDPESLLSYFESNKSAGWAQQWFLYQIKKAETLSNQHLQRINQSINPNSADKYDYLAATQKWFLYDLNTLDWFPEDEKQEYLNKALLQMLNHHSNSLGEASFHKLLTTIKENLGPESYIEELARLSIESPDKIKPFQHEIKSQPSVQVAYAKLLKKYANWKRGKKFEQIISILEKQSLNPSPELASALITCHSFQPDVRCLNLGKRLGKATFDNLSATSSSQYSRNGLAALISARTQEDIANIRADVNHRVSLLKQYSPTSYINKSQKQKIEQHRNSLQAGAQLAFSAYQQMGTIGIDALKNAFGFAESNIVKKESAKALFEAAPKQLALEIRNQLKQQCINKSDSNQDKPKSELAQGLWNKKKHQTDLISVSNISYGLTELAKLPFAKVPQAEYALFESLACVESGIAGQGTKILQQRLNDAQFTSALFSYLGVKKRFTMREFNIYLNALVSYKKSSPSIVKNMQRLIDLRRTPERVPWIHKLIALEALIKIGDPGAIAILEVYKTDQSLFNRIEVKKSKTGKVISEKKVPHKFSNLAQQAIDSIKSRQK